MPDIPGYTVRAPIRDGGDHSAWRAVRDRDGVPVVLKVPAQQPPGPRVLARLRHELEVTGALPSDRVVHALDLVSDGRGAALVLEDTGGAPLCDLVAPGGLPLPRFFELAGALAAALHDVHAQGIIHKDVKPSNAIIDPDGAVRLTDFGMSVALAHQHEPAIAPGLIEGTLAYMAPEQTGRMNRPVDRRTDLYALGVSLYELLTGELPFRDTDPLALVHRHVAVRPEPPHALRRDVPPALSRLVMRLLEKSAENRYQTAVGVLRDLDACAEGGDFELGRRDVSDVFRVPREIFGRVEEIAAIEASFGRASAGAVEMLRVFGPSGIGKSALVGELTRLSSTAGAIRADGKFEQYRRDLPYGAVLQAFAQFARRLLAEPEERLSTWRTRLVEALAPNARVLAELVPELAILLGPQPEVVQLGLTESQIRFQHVIRRFVRTVAGPEHPLVLFLDDVQWADGASLALIQNLLTDGELSHLLLVVAYRDNEVDASHPFHMLVQDLVATRRATIRDLAVGPLPPEAVVALVSRALGRPVAEVGALAEVVAAKTGGNPFFVDEFLRSLHAAGLIRFDASAGRWEWDEEGIGRQRTTSNVVDLVVRRIEKLSADTQRALQLAAVIGNTFDLATLARVSERSPRQTAAALRPALAAEIVVPLGHEYKYSELLDSAGEITFAFLHDRVHQAAYGTIDEAQRPGVHRRVGLLMLGGGLDVEHRLLDVVNHLNEAAALATESAERVRLAELNLAAARRAIRSLAWEAADRYARVGREALPEGAWEAHFGLAWGLHFEGLNAAFLRGDGEALDALHDVLVAHARSEPERALATEVKVQYLVSTMQYAAALDVAVPLLVRLGVKIPRRAGKPHVVAGLLQTKWALAGRDVAGLADLPLAADPGVRVAMRVMTTVSAAAYFVEPDVFPVIVFVMVRTTLVHGLTPQSAFGFVCYGLAMCAVLGDFDGGRAFGDMAVRVMERLHATDLEARVRFLYALFIQVWGEPFAATLDGFKAGAASGLETGDLEYYSYCFYGLDAHRLMMGEDLGALAASAAGHHEAIVRVAQQKVSLVMLPLRETVAWLRGEAPVSVGELDEARVLVLCEERRDKTAIGYCHVYRCMRAALGGDHDTVLVSARRAREVQEGLDGQAFVPLFEFYESLALLARKRAGLGGNALRVAINQRRLGMLARRVPSNFAAKHAMVAGEQSRGRGRVAEAMLRYEAALGYARESGNAHDLALAQQLAGECLVDAGLAESGRPQLAAAAASWERWGAARLAAALRERHRIALNRIAAGPETSTRSSGDLDVESITRAARAVAEKLRFTEVVQEVLGLALSGAGATRGALLLREDAAGWRVHANAEVGRGVTLCEPVALDAAERTARSVVLYTVRTGRAVVLDDAARDPSFGADPRFASDAPRAVLCVPLTHHGQTTGALYLENALAPGAFTRERVEFLTVLGAQAAISIENARLVRDLERSLAAQVELTGAHARFVPHQFLASLGKTDIRDVRLGDHTAKVLSVLFSDIRGFTPLVESMTPEASIRFINAYLARMEPPILEHGGFVDSYIGDAIMALFDGEADRAVEAGVGMLRALRRFNEARVGAGERPVSIGVGINTGPLMLGTIGGPNRLKCGVIGDSVNLAARIEALTKQLGVPLLIGQHTFTRLKSVDRFLTRPVERAQVVGLTDPVTLHEVFDADEERVRDAKEATRERFLAAFAAYGERRWDEAESGFRACAAACAQDLVAAAWTDRCAALRAQNPGPEWDGVWRMVKK